MDEYGKQVLRRAGADDEIIDAVLSIRNGCAEYGLSGVRRRPAEQLRAPYLIRVNIGSQWFPSFLIGLQPTYIPQIFS